MEYLNKWLSSQCNVLDINKYFFGIRDDKKQNSINYKLMSSQYGYLIHHHKGELPQSILSSCSHRTGIPIDYLKNRIYCEIGFYYLKIKCETNNAIKYFQKAIDNHSAEGLFLLSLIYCDGEEFDKAIELCERSALEPPKIQLLHNKGVIANYRVHEAQYHVGHLYSKTKKDYTKTFNYYLMSAENGNTRGAYVTSMMYKKGVGCQRDEENSKKYLLKAKVNVKQQQHQE
ncbi:hypothetical protein DFA_00182 [Cavenderia fasciculata]|uniref:Uncharacterized protein n=1 Tax=Cavenderia fasciculata TaxID=261658 RepID=F4PXU4_CACFS|nr:uncharacterized protein DFA_00182 [Cavenderia fasciculata]EGG19604.1 hypothetical protein DFA_00182 [Cavenderia fasciculata]|eukprot:XP_004357898.1 hypothetical protein DFA_00182 [Cavenderia fasciculata]